MVATDLPNGTSPALDALDDAARLVAPVSLERVLASAALQTRTDRKYLLRPAVFEALVDGIRHDHQVLEIDGLRTFRYRSVYFDTPDLASYRGAAHGRRRKFKVRTRTYLDTADTFVEVKTEGGRRQTVKARLPQPGSCAYRLDGPGAAFVDDQLDFPGMARSLSPVLTTTYARTTLVDIAGGARMTCDADLEMTDIAGATARMTDHVLVETKATSAAGPTDRLLWALGARPLAISKYGVGLGALRPEIPANRWHRTLRRYFPDCPRSTA